MRSNPSVHYLRCPTTRKRVKFYATDRKFGHNGFALVTLDDFHSRLTKRGSNNNGDRTARKKIFFSLPQSRRFPRRPLFKFIAHSYLFYSTERIRDPPAAGTVPIQLSYVPVVAMISDASQARN